jgi:hypothetical protein
LTECQPAAIPFSDGTPPYFISVLPAGQVSAAPLLQFPEQTTSPYTWNVNLPAGTNMFVLARTAPFSLLEFELTRQHPSSVRCEWNASLLFTQGDPGGIGHLVLDQWWRRSQRIVSLSNEVLAWARGPS